MKNCVTLLIRNKCHVHEEDKGRLDPCSRSPPNPLRNLLVLLLVLFLVIVGFTLCRAITALPQTTQIPTLPATTTFTTVAPATIIAPTLAAPTLTAPAVAIATPVVSVQLPVENSEWYIDGWAEDSIVVNMYGREMRFDLAEFRNSQTNVPIVVQCIDLEATTPNLDFTLPIEQRDRFIYKGNLFWHTTDPSMQRFIFVRHGELP